MPLDHTPAEHEMNPDCDRQSSRTLPVWPIVVALVVGTSFVASMIGVFLYGYIAGPNLTPPRPNGSPAWDVQLQPDDKISVDDKSSLFRELIASEGDELQIEINRDGEKRTIQLTPQSQEK